MIEEMEYLFFSRTSQLNYSQFDDLENCADEDLASAPPGSALG